MVQVQFLLNGRHAAASCLPGTTLLDWLRRNGLTGTKEACGEGDCGACTVAVTDNQGRFRAVNSCLYPLAKVAGRHVVTSEGLARAGRLHPIQQALLDNHAVQCGYCTPGVVMSLFCLFANNPQPDSEDIAAALEGNLCRCTGYETILATAQSLRRSQLDLSGWFTAVPPGPALTGDYYLPTRLTEALALLARLPNGRIIAGGTDVMGEQRRPSAFVDLSRVAELQPVSYDSGIVTIGAGVTLTAIQHQPIVREHLPTLAGAIGQMASAQIRNVATLAGNIVSASPVADGAVLLLALSATVAIASPHETRTLPLEQFFTGYRQTALRPGELVTEIRVPAGKRSSFIKTGKRSAVDIASVSSALALDCDGSTIRGGRLALGGVAPTTVLSAQAGALLAGATPSWPLAEAAAAAAAAEVAPISDVRGSAEFRRTLVRNQVLSHFIRLFPNLAEAR